MWANTRFAPYAMVGHGGSLQKNPSHPQRLADLLNVRISMPETGSCKTAAQTLDAGKPAIAWVDRAYMLYLQMPEKMKAHIGHIVAVCGRNNSNNNGYWIDDRAAAPYLIPIATFADARERITSYKQRLLLVDALYPMCLPTQRPMGIAGPTFL